MWERLAEVETLPAEGQRQVARQYSAALDTLLRHPNLDPEVRERAIDDLPSWSMDRVVESGTLTAAEVVRLFGRFPGSASLLLAALRHPDTTDVAERHMRELAYDTAAKMWMEGRSGSDLATLLLPVILTKQPQHQPTGYQADRYERSSLVRAMVDQLPAQAQRDWIHDPEHGPAVQLALLSGGPLSDDVLLACLPEITRSTPITSGQTPVLVEYLRRYPQLLRLAGPELASAASHLIADGWSPTKAAQAGQWVDLVIVTRIAETGGLIEELSRAAVFECASPPTVATNGVQWQEPRRYELIDTLVAKTSATDKQITFVLERLGTSHISELQQSAGKRSRLRRLSADVLASRQAHKMSVPQRSYPANLPTDDELSAMDDPVDALLQSWKNRGHARREAVAAHVLASRYTTEDLAWRLPIGDLEQHPVWGTRLAEKIVALCGDSPARWQELTRSWGPQSTQLLATTLFSRLENIHE